MAWDGKDFVDLPILVKTKGKTTTDHISPAGPWLRYRGHLDKISDNMFLGAVNAFTGQAGKGVNPLTGEADQPFAKIARELKAAGQPWIVIGDENYGEGSSREHAAMSPRYLGCAAVHGAQLRAHPRDEPQEAGRAAADVPGSRRLRPLRAERPGTISGLYTLEPGRPVTVRIKKPDGRMEEIQTRHSMTREQIAWFRAGSALNAGQPIDPKTGADGADDLGARWSPATRRRSQERTS